jgi:proteic killer suppression protein/toxin YoeB
VGKQAIKLSPTGPFFAPATIFLEKNLQQGYNILNRLVKLTKKLSWVAIQGVKLKYKKPSVEKYFSNFNLMNKEKGKDLTRAIKKRCDQLKAASNFGIYLSTGLGKPHPLYGNLRGCYGISITGNIRLIVRPDAEALDPASLTKCNSVIIEGVMSYHGQKQEWLIP